MTAEASRDFPFVATLPKKEKSKFARIWDAFEELRIVVKSKGLLVPIPLAAKIIGVSQQRVHNLIKEGRLEIHDVDGHNFVGESSVIAYAKSERKAGRPMIPEGNTRAEFSELRKVTAAYASEEASRIVKKIKR